MTNFNQQKQSNYLSFQGIVISVSNQNWNGCNKIVEVQNEQMQIVNFILTPDTFVIDQAKIMPGMSVIGFYDANVPTILIYPPQFQAVVIGILNPWENIKVDLFDNNLVSQDQTLKLNITDSVDITLTNGQDYSGSLANRNLVVIYTTSTRSIPAQTTPQRIIVLCTNDR